MSTVVFSQESENVVASATHTAIGNWQLQLGPAPVSSGQPACHAYYSMRAYSWSIAFGSAPAAGEGTVGVGLPNINLMVRSRSGDRRHLDLVVLVSRVREPVLVEDRMAIREQRNGRPRIPK